MIGRRLSHYEIVESLGVGGMGEVYRARDPRLDRDVALKVLPAGSVADEAARQRFRKEALAASRLAHAGIATVYEFDTEDALDFLVMEFVPGDTLQHRLEGGPLPEPEAVAIAAQVADALEAAHELGVVHCDLKPANVVVTPRGQAKVLDFGLAQLHARDHAASSTSSPSSPGIAGTFPYLAPEQVTGGSADARTDVHALGLLLYEMLTGRRAFTAEREAALLYSIVNTAPEPPHQLRPGLTPGLERVVLRALEKRPDQRHPSARAFREDLLRLQGDVAVEVPRRITSLAVLPLQNLSGDPAEEFFADGMTEALIGDLAQVAALRVISRTSVMRFKGTREPLPEIARALRVDAVVEGSVLRAGDRVRISAQLIEAATDRHLWGRSYERDFGDILALQRDVAHALADEIRVQLSPQESERLTASRPVNPAAYDAYLRGRFQWNRRTPESVRRGIEWFERAIEADPSYALAWAGLADSYSILRDQHAIAPEEAGPRARAAALKALEIDPLLAEAMVSLAFHHSYYDRNWSEAERLYRRALELQPNYATGHQWYAEFLVMHERTEEAVAESRRARELDPLSSIIAVSLADILYYSRRYDESASVLHATITSDPSFVHARNDLARTCTQLGRHDEAIAGFLAGARMREMDPDLSPGLGYAYAAAGRVDDARRLVARLEAERGQRYFSAQGIGVIHAALGDFDRAFEWLERAFTERDGALSWLRVNPRLDPLRGDPRFTALLAKLGLGG